MTNKNRAESKTKEKTSLCLIFPEMGIQSVSPLVPLQMYFPLSSEREIFSAFTSRFDLKIQPFMPNEIPITFNAGNLCSLTKSAAQTFESNPNKIIIFRTAKCSCQSEMDRLTYSKDTKL